MARREVVGQRIEYAANGIVDWPIERVRQRFNADCKRRGKDRETFLRDELGTIDDVEGFWLRVK